MSQNEAHIPVYMSRHNETFPDGYGAFIDWRIGERVTVLSARGRRAASGTIRSEVKIHSQAPIIDGAHGRGQWIREVEIDGEDGLWTIPTNRIAFGASPLTESQPET